MRLRGAAIALVAIGCCLGATGAAQARTKKREHHHHHHQHKSHGRHAAGGASAEGKAHLKRANELAGDDDCKAAVEEYTKAFELLDDPAVLFNRAECYRRLGEEEHAADDYHAFLDRTPKATNRAEIEAKIAALEVPEPSTRETPAETAPPAPKEPVARQKPAETAPPAPKEPITRQKPAETTPPPEPPAPAVTVLSPPPTPEAKPEPVMTLRRAAAADDAGPPRGTRPWVWVALAVLVAGAAVGGYFMLRPRQEPPPESALGNYRF